jgi:hypothetical protein
VLGGVDTTGEQPMIELQLSSVVIETGGVFQDAMAHRLIAAVERLSVREVIGSPPTTASVPTSVVELPMVRSERKGPSLRDLARERT